MYYLHATINQVTLQLTHFSMKNNNVVVFLLVTLHESNIGNCNNTNLVIHSISPAMAYLCCMAISCRGRMPSQAAHQTLEVSSSQES